MGGQDDQDQYLYAGKGAKRRKQEELTEQKRKAAQSPQRERLPRRNKFKSRSRDDDEETKPINIKATIRQFVIDQDMTVREIEQALAKQGIELSKVTISAVRTETRGTIKLLIEQKLITPEKLQRHRRRKGPRQ